MNREEIEQQVVLRLKNRTTGKNSDTIGLNSLDYIQFIMELEDLFQVELDSKTNSIKELVELIYKGTGEER